MKTNIATTLPTDTLLGMSYETLIITSIFIAVWGCTFAYLYFVNDKY